MNTTLTYIPPTVGIKAAAGILRVHENYVLKMIQAGTIPATKIGKEWVMVTEDLVTHIRKKAAEEQKNRRTPKRKGGGRR